MPFAALSPPLELLRVAGDAAGAGQALAVTDLAIDPYTQMVSNFSPGLAVGVIIAVGVMVILLRTLGFSAIIGNRQKLVDEGKIATTVNSGVDEIKAQLISIDKRLGAVEFDLTNRPTRDDFFKLQLSQVEIKGELRATNQTVQSTAAAIARLEEGVYDAARRFAERETQVADQARRLQAREEAFAARERGTEGGA